MKRVYILMIALLIVVLSFNFGYAYDYKSLILSSDLLPNEHEVLEYEITLQCLRLDRDITLGIRNNVAHKQDYSQAISLLRLNISYLDSNETRGLLNVHLAETVHKLQVHSAKHNSRYSYMDTLYELAPYLSSSERINKDDDLGGGITAKMLIKEQGAKLKPTYTPEQVERYSNVLALIMGLGILIALAKWNIR